MYTLIVLSVYFTDRYQLNRIILSIALLGINAEVAPCCDFTETKLLTRPFRSCLKPQFQSEAKWVRSHCSESDFLFSCKWNSFSLERLCTQLRFERERFWNSKIGLLFIAVSRPEPYCFTRGHRYSCRWKKHFLRRPWCRHALSANPLSPNIHKHKFTRPICTGFGWDMLPWKMAKHFPLGDQFINFHSFSLDYAEVAPWPSWILCAFDHIYMYFAQYRY